ncbi:lysine 2,3-aminomutase [Burkholderia arboris]|uniref:Lysine 2,3-aminomutase n=1 Tax=Burkholderia arboris TaxID=488730 RepID=A0A9Q9SR68_9BURK|nr:lysine 2,3-aminomutase [Burkholderia arboris]MCA8489683.1 lysine 2,3-aminomutase [Burkholderia arboris]VWC42581.1 radical SAM superfamily protein [Burkholderia arboris]
MIELSEGQRISTRDGAPGGAPPRPSIAVHPVFKAYNRSKLDDIPQLAVLPPSMREQIGLVARVLPFKVNRYVVEQLIDWTNVPDDPLFRLTFPQPDMLAPDELGELAELSRDAARQADLDALVGRLRARMNPHPADQRLNEPELDGEPCPGIQHKYAQTVLYFPSHGQTCHAYCTFCFRWPQFVGDASLKFASSEAGRLHAYLRAHGEVTDLLMTGGDPMVMSAARLREYLMPLLEPGLEHVGNIRIGTKALTYWPYRFVSDPDTPELLALLRTLIDAGRNVTVMAHLNHWRELSTEIAEQAVTNLRRIGVVIRSQGPVLRHINDDAEVWRRNWVGQVRLGIVPYYMFVERDTGPRGYFELPLARALDIYNTAIASVSGLARSARGPSMSAGPGKVEVAGTLELQGQRYFLLNFLQARDPRWLRRPFLAKYSATACWLDQLEPPDGEPAFFFDAAYRAFVDAHQHQPEHA